MNPQTDETTLSGARFARPDRCPSLVAQTSSLQETPTMWTSFLRWLQAGSERNRAGRGHRRKTRPRSSPAPTRPVGGALFLERLETRVVPSFLAPRAFDAGRNPSSV